MKKSKYENSVFPYSLQSSLLHGELENTNITLRSPEGNFFFQNYMTNIVKIDKICKEMSTSHLVT